MAPKTQFRFNPITGKIDIVDVATGPGGNGVNIVNTQVFTDTGTYTPSVGMLYCIIEILGGGGGGGAVASSGASVTYAGGGGGAMGGYAKALYTAAQIGASKSVTIGDGGLPGVAGNNPGGNGGVTSVGALLSANGGIGGAGNSNQNTPAPVAVFTDGGLGGTSTVSSGQEIISMQGYPGDIGTPPFLTFSGYSGKGANSPYGAGGKSVIVADNPGNDATGYGSGGSGALANAANQAGGAGAPGYVIITEYIT